METTCNITLIDWIIVLAIFTGIGVGGLLCRKYVKGVSDFVVAGRHVRKYLGLSTGIAESIGLITFARAIQQGFLNGPAYMWMQTLDMIIVAVMFGYFGVVIVRWRMGGYMTVPQYFEKRYGPKTRLLVGYATALAGLMNFAIFPIVGSQFLTHFLGIPLSINVFGIQLHTIKTLMFAMITVAVIFTYAGGMISVMLTGFLQSMLITIGMVLMIVFCLRDTGVSEMVTGLKDSLGEAAFNPFLEGSYGVLFFLWIAISTFFVYISFSPTMQKIASTDSPKTAMQMTLLSSFFNKGRLIIMMLVGICALVAVGQAVPQGMDISREQWSRIAGPLYLGSVLPPVALGIVLAGLCAAFVSTVDTYLLCWGAVIVNDIVCVVKKKPMTPERHILILRVVVILIAVFLFIFGSLYEPKESILEYIYLTGAMFSGIGIAIVLGLYIKRTSSLGACGAILTTALVPMADMILKRVSDGYAKHIKAEYSGLATILGALMICILLSLLFPDKNIKKTKINEQGDKNE